MSPEITLKNVPGWVRKQLKEQMAQGYSYQDVIQRELIAYRINGRCVEGLLIGDQVSDRVQTIARKPDSEWYLVTPLYQSSTKGTGTFDCHPDQEDNLGSHNNYYRGKHRMHTNRSGLNAFFRKPPHSR